jgi:hypothetical protein
MSELVFFCNEQFGAWQWLSLSPCELMEMEDLTNVA